MTLLPVLVDLRNAYEAHDRDAFDRTLQRLQARLIAADISAQAHKERAERLEARANWERELLTFPAVVDPAP